MKILIIGTEGQVAFELRRTLACLGEVMAVGRTSNPALDLTDLQKVRTAVQTYKPGLIVNAAAYTAVDKAEAETEQAMLINAEAVGVLAEEASKLGCGLIHYSTDYVFPGNAIAPYTENDATGPLGVYGRSKLLGEEAIRSFNPAHLILRTSWVYGGRGHNFLLTMLRLMKDKPELKVVSDQHGAPTWSRMIAEATALMVAKSSRNNSFDPGENAGTYHLTAGGQTTWFDFAASIREVAIAHGLLTETSARVLPIPTTDYPTPAQRPGYSVLSNGKLKNNFELALPDWEQSLKLCLSDMATK